jgi:hypothetical protein
MQGFSMRTTVVAGAIAALALGSGMVPTVLNSSSTPTAQAAELAQPVAGPHRPASFQGHRSHFRPGFSHAYGGWGYHRLYPHYDTQYAYEPVNICSTYYFDDAGVWFCFTGN